MSELVKEMKSRGIKNFWDLTEFDAEWVNEATRKDIASVHKNFRGEVFGLDFWSWKELRGEALLNCKNFEVSLVILEDLHDKAREIIEDYLQRRLGNVDEIALSKEVIERLHILSAYNCCWV